MKNVAFTAGLLVAGLMFTSQASAREGHALVQTVSGEAKMTVDGKKKHLKSIGHEMQKITQSVQAEKMRAIRA